MSNYVGENRYYVSFPFRKEQKVGTSHFAFTNYYMSDSEMGGEPAVNILLEPRKTTKE